MSRIQIESLMPSDLIILDSQDSGKVFGGRRGGDYYDCKDDYDCDDDYDCKDDYDGKGEGRKKFYPYDEKCEYKPTRKYC